MSLEPATVVIFGASGDLTQRKLVPALHSLACEGLLSPRSQVVGLARSHLSDAEFRRRRQDAITAELLDVVSGYEAALSAAGEPAACTEIESA